MWVAHCANVTSPQGGPASSGTRSATGCPRSRPSRRASSSSVAVASGLVSEARSKRRSASSSPSGRGPRRGPAHPRAAVVHREAHPPQREAGIDRTAQQPGHRVGSGGAAAHALTLPGTRRGVHRRGGEVLRCRRGEHGATSRQGRRGPARHLVLAGQAGGAGRPRPGQRDRGHRPRRARRAGRRGRPRPEPAPARARAQDAADRVAVRRRRRSSSSTSPPGCSSTPRSRANRTRCSPAPRPSCSGGPDATGAFSSCTGSTATPRA